MVTTNRMISLDTVGRNGEELIHLSGPLQVVARADTDGRGGIPCQLDLRCDAAGVRGVGLKAGGRYWVEGRHCSTHRPEEIASPFLVLGHFVLRGLAPADARPTRQRLTVCFRVTVPAEGRVTVTAEGVEILPA
jgi:hypothetical protein